MKAKCFSAGKQPPKLCFLHYDLLFLPFDLGFNGFMHKSGQMLVLIFRVLLATLFFAVK